MRILVITWGCDREDISEAGVTARWVEEIAKEHEVTLFAVSKPERFGCVRRQFPQIDVIEWKDIALPSRFERFRAIVKPGYFVYYLRARRFIRELVRKERFDVIHHLSPFSWRYPTPAAGLGVPVVKGPVAGGLQTPPGLRKAAEGRGHKFMWLRKADKWRLRFDPLLRRAYRLTDHLLVAAPYVRDILQPLQIRSCSTEIEHGLAEVPERHTRPLSQSVEFLFVGRIVPTKGVRLAIRAFAQSSCRDASFFTVVGDGGDLAACRAEAEQLGVAGRMRFLGWLPVGEVEQQYKRADVFVFPSFREPTGGVLLEAMSNGLPVITCAYGGPDYMVDEHSGVKIAPGTEAEFVEATARAMELLAFNPELRARLGLNGYLRAQNEFGWAAKRKRVGELYQTLAGRVL